MHDSHTQNAVERAICAIVIVSGSLAATLAVLMRLGNAEQSFRDSLPTDRNLASLGLFVLILFAAHHALAPWDNARGKRVITVLSVLFGLAELLGNSLHDANSLEALFANGEQRAKTLVAFAGYAYLFAILSTLLFRYLEKRTIVCSRGVLSPGRDSAAQADTASQGNNAEHPRRFFFITWALIFLAYLPYFLALFPGVSSYDSHWQLQQVLGITRYTDHHPIAHTLLIQVFVKGTMLLGGDINAGVAVFSLAQMAAMSGVFAYALCKMLRWGIDRRLVLAAGLFFALFPINAIYSVTMWKDIPFGGAMLLLTLVLIDLLRQKEKFFNKKSNWILLIAAFLAVALLRNNGIYVVLIAGIVMTATLKSLRRQLLCSLIVCVTCFGAFKVMVSAVFDVAPGPVREVLSVPMQQFARIAKEHGDQLNEGEKEFLCKLNQTATVEELAERYNPTISDPVKWYLDAQYLSDNMGKFVQTWATLCVKYPGTAVTAFLNNNYGYWTVYESRNDYWTAFTTVHENDFGLRRNSLFPALGEFIMKHYLANYNSTPVYSQAYSLGLGFWVLMLCAAALIWRKRRVDLLALLPLFVLWLTCCASPVHGEYRYMYGVITALPAVIGYALFSPSESPPNALPSAPPNESKASS
ncbi:MAG: DUF6020 family protein [Oscillospiraceae bacterium]|nr:DUF6020 family protein [Oscillospiraceae bacterium]